MQLDFGNKCGSNCKVKKKQPDKQHIIHLLDDYTQIVIRKQMAKFVFSNIVFWQQFLYVSADLLKYAYLLTYFYLLVYLHIYYPYIFVRSNCNIICFQSCHCYFGLSISACFLQKIPIQQSWKVFLVDFWYTCAVCRLWQIRSSQISRPRRRLQRFWLNTCWSTWKKWDVSHSWIQVIRGFDQLLNCKCLIERETCGEKLQICSYISMVQVNTKVTIDC